MGAEHESASTEVSNPCACVFCALLLQLVLCVQEMVEVAQKLGPGIIRQLDHFVAAAAAVTS